MNIGLYGIYGVYNFGCEAIVRGCYSFLQKLYPGCKVTYFSFYYDYDKRMLQDIPVDVIQINRDRNVTKRAANKLCYLLKIPFANIMFDYEKMIHSVDELYFIGGDILTIPEVLRKQKKYPYINEMIEVGKKADKCGVPVVLYGASVGPFGDYERALSYYKTNLSIYKSIICREHESTQYLKDIGLQNIFFSPDPAFLVNNETNKADITSAMIGLNLSPLSLREIYGELTEERIKELSLIIKRMYDRFQMKILLIPHVISPDVGDDDLRFQQRLLELLPAEYKGNIKIVDYKGGFLGVKKQLQQCKIVVTARMHCAINAIHEDIPTIFLSYSKKSIGMCEYVYGTKKWIVDLKMIDKTLLNTVESMLNQTSTITEYLKQRNQEIQKQLVESIQEIK